MDFRFSAADEAWRQELRGWIRQEFGPDWSGFRASGAHANEAEEEYEFTRDVRRKLAARGWTAPA